MNSVSAAQDTGLGLLASRTIRESVLPFIRHRVCGHVFQQPWETNTASKHTHLAGDRLQALGAAGWRQPFFILTSQIGTLPHMAAQMGRSIEFSGWHFANKMDLINFFLKAAQVIVITGRCGNDFFF